jgi:hypothetical protein
MKHQDALADSELPPLTIAPLMIAGEPGLTDNPAMYRKTAGKSVASTPKAQMSRPPVTTSKIVMSEAVAKYLKTESSSAILSGSSF